MSVDFLNCFGTFQNSLLGQNRVFLLYIHQVVVYVRCMYGTFLIQIHFKSCFIPLEPQIPSSCIISKSLGKFRVIESIHGIVRDVDDQPFHWIRSVSNRLTYVLRSQHDI